MRVPGITEDPARGDRIRAAREAAGLTQVQLGEQLGVASRTVSAWESGAVLNHSNLKLLAIELDVTSGFLLTGEGPRRPLSLEEHDRRTDARMRALEGRLSQLETALAGLATTAEQILLATELAAPPGAEAGTTRRGRSG